MALSDQIRKRRQEQRLSLAELARLAKVSKGYLSVLETKPDGPCPSVDVLSRIAVALGTSVSTLLDPQIEPHESTATVLPETLRRFALTENLSDHELFMLAHIEYKGKQPQTVKDWFFLYEAIKRSVHAEEGEVQGQEEH